MVLNYEGRIKRGECIHLGFLIRHNSPHHQDISCNIFTLINITLSTVYEIYVSFRKIKDQGTEMEVIMVLT